MALSVKPYLLQVTMSRSAIVIFKMCMIFALFNLLSPLALAGDVDPVPNLEGRITDTAKVLSAREIENLTDILASYEKETHHQFAVLIVPALNGETIESFSFRVANAWKLGLKDVDNGILITIAIQERKTRISLGLGMERYISNETCSAIIRDDMLPFFRHGNFAGGLEAGLDELMKKGRKFVVPSASIQ